MKSVSSQYSAIYLAIFFMIAGYLGFIYINYYQIENLRPYTIQSIISLLVILIYLVSQIKIDLRDSLNIINIYITMFLLFFVIGALLLSFGSKNLIYLKLTEFNVHPQECFEVNNYNYLGFGISLFIAKFIELKFGKIDQLKKYIAPRVKFSYLLILLAVLIFSRLYIFLLNMYPDFYTNYGLLTILSLSSNGIIGILLYFNKIKLDIIAILFSIIFIILGLLEFSKLISILPIVVLGCSLAIRHNSKLIIFSTFLVAFFFLKTIYPLVNYSRINIGKDRSVAERLEVLNNGYEKKYLLPSITSPNDVTLTKDEANELVNLSSDLGYSIWFRICYVTEQVAAMRFYKNGMGSGEQLLDVAWLFLPRILFPNKPKFSNHIGPGLYYKMTGYYNSSSSSGIFIEGYYRNGNIGFMVNTLISGMVLGFCQIFLAVALARKNYLMIPFIFLFFIIPFRIDGHFVIDILATFITTSLLVLTLNTLLNFEYIYGIIKKRVL